MLNRNRTFISLLLLMTLAVVNTAWAATEGHHKSKGDAQSLTVPLEN